MPERFELDGRYAISSRSYSGKAEFHRHDYHQFVLKHSGSLEIEIEGSIGAVDEWHGAFIAAGERHMFAARGDNLFSVVDLRHEVLQLMPSAARARQFLANTPFFPITPPIRNLVDYLAAIPDSDRTPLAGSWTALLVAALAGDKPRHTPPVNKTLAAALDYMRSQLAYRIHIDDIAAASNVSKTTLHRRFREALGVSPHSKLAQMRLDRAVRLLHETDLSIAEIAYRTGYTDQSALTRYLKEATGITPAAMRRKRSAETAEACRRGVAACV